MRGEEVTPQLIRPTVTVDADLVTRGGVFPARLGMYVSHVATRAVWGGGGDEKNIYLRHTHTIECSRQTPNRRRSPLNGAPSIIPVPKGGNEKNLDPSGRP